MNHNLTDSLTLQLFYQYQRADADRANYSYYENIVYFRLVKLLP